MGIGTVKDVAEARAWYRAAAEHGDKRANQRLTALGGQPVPFANELAGAGVEAIPGAGPGQRPDQARPQPTGRPQQPGQANGGPVRPMAMTAKEQGQRVAAEHAHRMILQAEQAKHQQNMAPTQPINAPFPSAVEISSMSPNSANGPTNFPTPMAMRDSQTAQREHAFHMAVQQQQQQRMRGSPIQGAAPQPRPPYGAEAAYFQHQQPQQQRPPPGRQGGMLPNLPPGSSPYPSYPNQNYLPPAGASPSIAGSPPQPATSNEKKRSLWTQLKQI